MAFGFFKSKKEKSNEANTSPATAREVNPAPKQETPAPKQETPAPKPAAPAPRQETPAPKPAAPAAENPGRQPNQTENRSVFLGGMIRRNRKLFFDSSSINQEGFLKFVQANEELIRTSKRSFFVPDFELAKVAEGSGVAVRMLIQQGGLSCLQYSGVSDYQGFLAKVAVMSQENGQLCFVVNDAEKRRAILTAAKSAGVFVGLFAVSADGQLLMEQRPNREKPSQESRPATQPGSRPAPRQGNVREDAFAVCTTPERMKVTPIRVSELREGATVYNSQGQSVRLTKRELVNPGAVTYSTDTPGVWAKVFNADAVNTFLEAKVRRMLTKNVSRPGLCWPTDVLVDRAGNFVGMLVPPAKGEPLHLSVFKQAKLQATFPNWDKRDLCDLALTILRTVEYLHSMNILLGCINPAAIRVVSKDEVYFTDTDNYQIEGFPTLVYNVSFTPPEFQGKRIYLSSKASEYYAVAVLTFMLLMPGKTPYTVERGEEAAVAVTAKRFPFPNGKIRGTGTHTLPGMWRFMWSHLSPRLKDAFYHTFQKNGNYELAANRLPTGEWIRLVFGFRKDLDKPEDRESLKLYPSTFKRTADQTFLRCEICGVYHPEFYFSRKYFDIKKVCNSCIGQASSNYFDCEICSRRYFYTNETALFHETMRQKDPTWSRQKYCKECKSKKLPCRDCGTMTSYFLLRDGRCRDCGDRHRNQVYTRARCKECGCIFDITVGEHEFNLSRGFNDPVRCPDCRKRRKSGY